MLHPPDDVMVSAFAFTLAIATLACRSDLQSAPGDPADKIDAPVASAMGDGSPVPVLILGRTQLLEFPDGFRRFTETHANRDRGHLRSEVITELKAIASAEQAEILAGLDSQSAPHPLWLVNGIVVELSSSQIRQAAELASVKYIYHAGFVSGISGDAGSVSQVLQPSDRPTFSSVGKSIPWNVELIGANRVWNELGVTGEGVVVAVLDNGANYTHSDLRDNIWINEGEVPNNGADDDGNGYVDDYYGFNFRSMRAEVGDFSGQSEHGSWVSGIIAGDGTAGTVTGIAPRAKLMLLMQNNIHSAVLAHQYALENGADVINMSFSLPNLGNLRGVWRLMAEQAIAAGLVMLSGAGNFQQSAAIPEQLRIPEGIPSVIAVGGVGRDLAVTFFSSLGPVEWSSVRFYSDLPSLTKPDVAAFPGPGYPLLGLGGSGYINPNTSIAGNSFSGPHAAGVAALMLSAQPGLPAWRVKEIMEATAEDLGPTGKDNSTGSGLLNAHAAVMAAMGRGLEP